MATQAVGTLGTRIYISSTPLVDIYAAADTIGEFQALTYANEIGLVENLGEFSRLFELVTFNSIGDGRTLKLKGPYNDGALQMVCAMDLTDPGQALLFTAGKSLTQTIYPFKLVFNGSNAYFGAAYFGGLVMSYRLMAGAANSVLRAQINIEVDTEVFIGDNN